MKLLLMPTIQSLLNEFDDADFADDEQLNEELLARQGYEAELLVVEDGEEFEIPVGKEASIIFDEDDDEGSYFFSEEVEEGVVENQVIWDNLEAGKYQLDGNVVNVIELYEKE